MDKKELIGQRIIDITDDSIITDKGEYMLNCSTWPDETLREWDVILVDKKQNNKITRFELRNEQGEAEQLMSGEFDYSLQDNGKTLKVFMKDNCETLWKGE